MNAPTKLEALELRIKQLKNQADDIRARESAKARKDEAKRLILTGRAVEIWAASDPDFAAKLRKNLDSFATRPQDRVALGL